jgi:hypothetical protein
LPKTCESYANGQIGKLALAKGQLDRGIVYLLRCLRGEQKSANVALDAAMQLRVIYSEAGRSEEANALTTLATAANTRGLALTRKAEEQIRGLLRSKSRPALHSPSATLKHELRVLKGKFTTLPGEYPTQVQVVRFGSPPQTLQMVALVCDDAIRALDQGLDVNNQPINPSGVANGLKRMVKDARQDTGLVATTLNPLGVRRYSQYLDELESLANRMK